MRRHQLILALALLVGACSHDDGDDLRAEAADESTTTTSTTVEEPSASTSTSTSEAPATTTTTTTVAPSTTTTTVRAPEPRIVYIGEADEGEPIDVWTAALDGSDARVLIEDVHAERNAYGTGALSPDGTRFAYRNDVDQRVHVVRLDGGGDVVVAAGPAHLEHWLDDANVVVSDGAGAWSVPADGTGTPVARPWGSRSYDGRTVIQDHRGWVAVGDDGSEEVVAAEVVPRLTGVLSPDGTHVAYQHHSGCRCPYMTLEISNVDGSDVRGVPIDEPSYFGHSRPSWASADVLYVEVGEVSIDRVTLDGTPTEVLDIRHGFWKLLGVTAVA